jgi:hypothetical protein
MSSEMKATSVVHRGIRYSVGDKFRSLDDETLSRNGMTEVKGMINVTIFCIDDDHIGVTSDTTLPGWHTLDHRVPPGRGYYLRAPDLAKYFERIPATGYEISEDMMFKNRNLKGMSCTTLDRVKGSDLYFVELSENVGGGGADGLGKSGHCVLVPANKLKVKKKEEIKDE